MIYRRNLIYLDLREGDRRLGGRLHPDGLPAPDEVLAAPAVHEDEVAGLLKVLGLAARAARHGGQPLLEELLLLRGGRVHVQELQHVVVVVLDLLCRIETKKLVEYGSSIVA